MPYRLLPLVPLLAACSNGVSYRGGPPERAAYVAAANAVCADVNTRIAGVRRPTSGLDYMESLRSIARAFEDGQRRLRALSPPLADAGAVETNLLRPNDERVRLLADAVSTVLAKSETDDMAGAVESYDYTLSEVDRIATSQRPWERSFGLTECAR